MIFVSARRFVERRPIQYDIKQKGQVVECERTIDRNEFTVECCQKFMMNGQKLWELKPKVSGYKMYTGSTLDVELVYYKIKV